MCKVKARDHRVLRRPADFHRDKEQSAPKEPIEPKDLAIKSVTQSFSTVFEKEKSTSGDLNGGKPEKKVKPEGCVVLNPEDHPRNNVSKSIKKDGNPQHGKRKREGKIFVNVTASGKRTAG